MTTVMQSVEEPLGRLAPKIDLGPEPALAEGDAGIAPALDHAGVQVLVVEHPLALIGFRHEFSPRRGRSTAAP